MKFSSVELQTAFDNSKSILENITLIKDTISEEIKFLEKFLKTQAIDDDFTYTITSPFNPISLNIVYDGEHNNVCTNEELLIWDSEKKRIIYQHNQYLPIDCINDGRVFFSYETLSSLINRPLIETPFEIRKKVYERHLSPYLLEITNKYRLAQQNS